MRKSKFTDSQIMDAVKRVEAGQPRQQTAVGHKRTVLLWYQPVSGPKRSSRGARVRQLTSL